MPAWRPGPGGRVWPGGTVGGCGALGTGRRPRRPIRDHRLGGSVGRLLGMGKPVAVVWDRSFLGYDLGGDHPLNPVRLDLTIRLATALGVLDGVEMRVPVAASDEEIELVHKPGYLSAVQAAP